MFLRGNGNNNSNNNSSTTDHYNYSLSDSNSACYDTLVNYKTLSDVNNDGNELPLMLKCRLEPTTL